MIRFWLRRYVCAVAANRRWLLLALVPPTLYLAIAAVRPASFSVRQDVAVTADSPILVRSRPAAFARMRDVVAQSRDFLQGNSEPLAVHARLKARLPREDPDSLYRVLNLHIADVLSLTMPADGRVRLTYSGRDRALGETVVEYYAERLVHRADEGRARTRRLLPQEDGAPEQSDTAQPTAGPLHVSAYRTVWQADRLGPAMLFLFVCLFLILALLGLDDTLADSFRSQRQMSRYLELPVLGSIPDLDPIAAKLSAQLGADSES